MLQLPTWPTSGHGNKEQLWLLPVGRRAQPQALPTLLPQLQLLKRGWRVAAPRGCSPGTPWSLAGPSQVVLSLPSLLQAEELLGSAGLSWRGTGGDSLLLGLTSRCLWAQAGGKLLPSALEELLSRRLGNEQGLEEAEEHQAARAAQRRLSHRLSSALQLARAPAAVIGTQGLLQVVWGGAGSLGTRLWANLAPVYLWVWLLATSGSQQEGFDDKRGFISLQWPKCPLWAPQP